MKKIFEQYLKGDAVIWIISLLLLTFSILSVYSFIPILVKVEGGSPFKYLIKHLVYVLLAFYAMFWVHRKNPIFIARFARIAYIIAIILLIFTFFFGTKVNDAGRWIKIPFVGLTFQSSDFAKLALILYLSKLLVKKQDKLNSWKEGFIPVLTPVVIICGLIIKDNFSTAVILFSIALIVMFVGKVPIGKLFLLFLSLILSFFLLVLIQKGFPDLKLLPRLETWENRLFRHQQEENNIENAQAVNAELAIYNGGFWGQGVGDGKLKEFIPEAYADFYYASFVEEFGAFFAVILVFLYLILLFRFIKIALKTESLFETYWIIGIGILLLSQATVNMMVCTRIFPVTGQNMPLLAMGGSALIMTSFSIGLVQSVVYSHDKKQEKTKDENILADAVV
ncbi:MAG: FtsW/RodA/SpoVE family cell cycle protein [Flavobacteriia bacterium]|nr:FtsW/RodA/SpoVE family cell cycle protein [Flavobacteriia bacterium]